MKVTHKSRILIRLQNIVFVVLFLAVMGMLAWLSTRYSITSDWTEGSRNSLSPASISLLQTIPDSVEITAFVRSAEEKQYIRQLIDRYRSHKKNLTLKFVDPDSEPQLTREMGITNPMELVVRYGKRSQNISNITEQTLTNALQRVARSSDQFIVFVTGHGERDINGQANHDLRTWSQQLENKGFRTQTINLVETPQIPSNTAVLVIAGPRVKLLPGEVHLIRKYLEQGGNLLWLADPGKVQYGLQPIAEYLDFEFVPGTIVDPTTQLFGVRDPRMAIVTSYNVHPVTRNFKEMTIFPQAEGIDIDESEKWKSSSLLQTAPGSWSETGVMKGQLELNRGEDISGPLTIAAAFTRDTGNGDKEQRIIVVGDGDFLSNTYIGNVGNLDLGMNMINWLSNQDSFIAIPAKTANDITLQIAPVTAAVIGFGFWLLFPLVLLGIGVVVWLRRRRR